MSLYENFIGGVKGLPPVGDKFADNAVVLPATGIGAVFAEVVRFSSNADESPVGCLVTAVLGKLFSFVVHVCLLKIKCQ